jgi:hypothetical protein
MSLNYFNRIRHIFKDNLAMSLNKNCVCKMKYVKIVINDTIIIDDINETYICIYLYCNNNLYK